MLLYVIFAGCSNLIEYDAVRDVCHEREWDSVESMFYVGISEDCANIIVESSSINSRSFGMNVSAITDADRTIDILIGGIHALLFTDLGTVGEVIEDPNSPSILVEFANNQISEGSVGVDSDFGEMIFNFSGKNLRRVAFDSSQESLMYSYRRKIFVDNLLTSEDSDLVFDVSIIYAASLFLHEEMHIYKYSPHIIIDGVGYDEDYDSTYGASAYFVGRWWNSLSPDKRTEAGCLMYYQGMYNSCQHIINSGGFCSYWYESDSRICENI